MLNLFSKIARGVTKRTHIPASNFVQAQTVMISAAFKTRDLPTQINHFSEEVALIEELACSFIECSKSRFLRQFRKNVSLKLIHFWFGKLKS